MVLIWRDHSATVFGGISSDSNNAQNKRNKATVKGNMSAGRQGKQGKQGAEQHRKGIVMEIAKSDLDTSHLLQYVQVSTVSIFEMCSVIL